MAVSAHLAAVVQRCPVELTGVGEQVLTALRRKTSASSVTNVDLNGQGGGKSLGRSAVMSRMRAGG